ncbi:hypothetical protein [Microbacterium sp. CJ88]|uniref:hypothetical protein n=1 Tax=Microbacterium sp. CJ88 TaxID=3445672 RepID=UPI003F65C322
MATRNDGLSAEEREAVKQRAKELREQEKAGKNREAGLASVMKALAGLDDADRAIGEGLHEIVSAHAAHLVPKTYYGMPGYADDQGKMVVFMQPASKFKTRYSTIGFEDRAHLDDGDVWPVAFAVPTWTPTVAKRITEAVKAAVA